MSVIWGGVCERHPKIRVAFLESGAAGSRGGSTAWTAISSELFRRNCWILFEPVEGSLKVLADYIGPNKILWATDYPHSDGFFPDAPKMILDPGVLPARTELLEPLLPFLLRLLNTRAHRRWGLPSRHAERGLYPRLGS